MKLLFIYILLFVLSSECFSHAFESNTNIEEIKKEDKIRIREAMRISEFIDDKIWRDWSSAPFLLILVLDKTEYLFTENDKSLSEGFEYFEFDSITERHIFFRPRIFDKEMLATFPAVDGIPTIVTGNPENTSLNSMQWVITILHEHFHQLQQSRTDYYSSVNNLGLAGEDNSGMWMLNYNFPYDDEKVSDMYGKLVIEAAEIYDRKVTNISDSAIEYYLNLKDSLKKMLIEKDYLYFSFQLWQEGMAKYTEIKSAEILSKENYEYSKEFKELNDFVSSDSFYSNVLSRLIHNSQNQNLKTDMRECFYTLGALEGLLLDKVNPGWRKKYFKEKFFTEKYFK